MDQPIGHTSCDDAAYTGGVPTCMGFSWGVIPKRKRIRAPQVAPKEAIIHLGFGEDNDGMGIQTGERDVRRRLTNIAGNSRARRPTIDPLPTPSRDLWGSCPTYVVPEALTFSPKSAAVVAGRTL